jgi:hypothetical protein
MYPLIGWTRLQHLQSNGQRRGEGSRRPLTPRHHRPIGTDLHCLAGLRGLDRLRTSARERLLRSWPQAPSCVSANAAAQTRIVSFGRRWPGRRELSHLFKYMACARIPEFESSHPSHGVEDHSEQISLLMRRVDVRKLAGQALGQARA